jgi:plastocyanin
VIDSFDSRALRNTDCYGQRFMRAGTYRYDLVNAAWVPATSEHPYQVRVTAAKGADRVMQQHTVLVRADGNRFRPDDETLRVDVGDLVVWHCPDAAGTPFAVVGDKAFFGNAALVNESGFSHAFSAAGEYPWVDAHGSDLGGVVRVNDPPCDNMEDFRSWQRQLSKGTLVMITGSRAEPAVVDILTGQTVYFAVVKAGGISVTDERLARLDPCKPPSTAAADEPAARTARVAAKKTAKKTAKKAAEKAVKKTAGRPTRA